MPLVETGLPSPAAYIRVADDEALPEGAVIVSAERLLAEGESLRARNGDLGVAWPNDRDVAELAPHLSRLTLVALDFPKFRDGRAFSQARLLRERLGFKGQLRACGNVLRDQLLMMVRAGFDAFDIEKEADAATFNEALQTYSLFYQPTGEGRSTVRDLRAARALQEKLS
ncbi:DUF934 domain-containing protein [Xanthobacter sp. TB0139]|uniref:DUF934 domain-containing protein n=1 Tax=Xanthobacter sp. TB0139 TaxID=3459178 RepID=UPI004039355F